MLGMARIWEWPAVIPYDRTRKTDRTGDKRILLREIKKDQDKFHVGFTLVSRGIRIILLYLVRG